MKGSRVQAIIRELRGEKIDIIEWSDEPSVFAANALSPAKVNQVRITDIENRQMEVIVNEDQLSLAIGKRGQNVRLATKLVGWNIDIRSEEEIKREVALQMGALIASGEAVPLSVIEGITAAQAETLSNFDINDIDALAATPVDDLVEHLDLSLDEAEGILKAANEVIAAREASRQSGEAAGEAETVNKLPASKIVVAEVTDPATELSLDEARELAGDEVEIGDNVVLPLPTDEATTTDETVTATESALATETDGDAAVVEEPETGEAQETYEPVEQHAVSAELDETVEAREVEPSDAMTAKGYDEAVEAGVPFSAESEILAQDSVDPVASTEADPTSEDVLLLQDAGRDLRPDTITPAPDITSSGAAQIEAAGNIGEGEPPVEEESGFSPVADFASEASAPEIQVTSAPVAQYREEAAPTEESATAKADDTADAPKDDAAR
jgi:hypothetical protein